MSEQTKIQWCDHTFNPWIGCTKVSPGCANCYAAVSTPARTFGVQWGKGQPRRRTSAENWKLPLKWNRKAERDGNRPRVFCASLADWLDDEVPIEWLADLLTLIHDTPNLDWLLLTKRPENFYSRIDALLALLHGPCTLEYAHFRAWVTNMRGGWSNVVYSAVEVGRENYWIGTTVEDQKRADERIPALLSIPATVHFLSMEPLLEPVDLKRRHHPHLPDGRPLWPTSEPMLFGIHWVIVGGESGTKARLCNVEWIRDIVQQCKDAGVPVFVKQLGAMAVTDYHLNPDSDGILRFRDNKGGDPSEWPEDVRVREWPQV